MDAWMDGWRAHLFMLDGKVDRLGEVGVIYSWQQHGKNVGVHLRPVHRFEVLMTEEALHPAQGH